MTKLMFFQSRYTAQLIEGPNTHLPIEKTGAHTAHKERSRILAETSNVLSSVTI